jgi:hypothetical protein
MNFKSASDFIYGLACLLFEFYIGLRAGFYLLDYVYDGRALVSRTVPDSTAIIIADAAAIAGNRAAIRQ